MGLMGTLRASKLDIAPIASVDPFENKDVKILKSITKEK